MDNEAKLLQYHHATENHAVDDETPWCSSFVNWVMQQAGYHGTRSAWAIDWSMWKEGVKLNDPAYGCIGVIDYSVSDSRKKGGHVGFVVGKRGKSLLLLGGNQGNPGQVKVSGFSLKEFIAFMMPKDFTEIDYQLSDVKGHFKTETFSSTR